MQQPTQPGRYPAWGKITAGLSAQVLRSIVVTGIVWNALYLVLTPVLAVRKLASVAIVATMLATNAIALHLLRRGRGLLASWLVLGTMWVAGTIVVMFDGGIHSPLTIVFLPLIVSAAYLLGQRVAWFAVALFLATTLALAIADRLGFPPPVYFTGRPFAIWSILLLAVFMITAPLIRVVDALKNALALTHRRADELSELDVALRESQERLPAIVEAAPDGIFILNLQGRVLAVNEAATKQLGYDREELLQLTVFDFVDTEFHERLKRRFPGLEGLMFYESRHVRKDGTVVPVELNTRHITYDGEPAVLGIARDITGRRLAEKQLEAANQAIALELRERTRSEREVRALSARLIHAQEAERTRIARELHDDFAQQIAAATLGAMNLRRRLPAELSEEIEQSDRIQRTLANLSEGIRRLSHELHPALLQYSGLATALRSYCAEFAALAGRRIDFHVEGACDPVAPEVALCVYRVAQEALQNSVKHAGVNEASVALRREDGTLYLVVSDHGVGMEPDAAGGLGMVSMRERTRLVNGTMEIKSALGEGVTITLRIPVEGKSP
jgi:PAS domain S-box-containing protein